MKHVLMIEDDATLQTLYKDAFVAQDFSLTTVNTGKEGLAKVKESPLPNLIILDIMLTGGLNGFDVLRELKKDPNTQAIPVLIMTNLDTERQSAMDSGASGYLVKSNTSIETVIATINSLLNSGK